MSIITLILGMFLNQTTALAEATYSKQCSTGPGVHVCVGDVIYTCKTRKPCQPLQAIAVDEKYTSWGSSIEVVRTSPREYDDWYFRTDVTTTLRACRRLCAPDRYPQSGSGGNGLTPRERYLNNCALQDELNRTSPFPLPCTGK